jgi:hypothetical protein
MPLAKDGPEVCLDRKGTDKNHTTRCFLGCELSNANSKVDPGGEIPSEVKFKVQTGYRQ